MAKNLLNIKRKKRKERAPKSFDIKYMGTEPVWDSTEPTSTELSRAYNWYTYFNNHKESLKLLFNEYPRDKREIKTLKKLEDWKIPSLLGIQARMLAMGCKLPEDSRKWFNSKIEELLVQAKKIVSEKKKVVKSVPKISIQDRIKEQINEYIGEVENEIDIFQKEYKSDFKMYKWLQAKNVKSQQSNAIAAYYKPLITELLEVQGGACESLNEAYSSVKKVDVERFVEFMAMIIGDAETWGANQKTVRKIRKKKPPSVVKQISKLKYLKEDNNYKLVSVNPAEIIGSNEVWTFNVKHRKLTRYKALSRDGFIIQGTTLKGIDVDRSEIKSVRKPNDVLPKVLNGGKRILNNILHHDVKSKGYEPNGRFNEDTIILRVIK